VASPPRTPDVLHEVDPAMPVGLLDGQPALDRARGEAKTDQPWAGALDGPAVELDQRNGWDEDGDADGMLRSDDVDEAGEVEEAGEGYLIDEDAELTAGPSSTAGHAWAVAGASMTGPTTPAYMPRPTRPRAAAPAAPTAPEVPAAPIDPPGAYVPPLPVAAVPAGPPAPARAWAGYGDASGVSAINGPNGTGAKDRAIDPSRIAEFIGSVSIAGAALAAVGFLLPWASVMIGASGSEYFDRWGLAGPGHVLVVIGILALLTLAVGSMLLGLTWPYLLGPLEAAPGVLIDAIGAVALIGSGVLALVTDRHAEVDKPV
jgi:hypothetical protein